MKKTTILGLTMGAATVLLAQSAFAQDPNAQGTATVGGGVSATVPAPPRATVAANNDGTTDHDKMEGRFAIGYFGISNLPIATAPAAAAAAPAGLTGSVAAPIIGARYWLNTVIGIDAGLGMGISGGSVENVAGATTTTTDKNGVFGMGLHAGVPIALGRTSKHLAWIVTPEMNVGFTSSSQKNPVPNSPDTKFSGFLLNVGARAGAELHFGFIGVPELSLQAGVGLMLFSLENRKIDAGNNVSTSDTTTRFLQTTVNGDPWAIFTNNISAFYYF